MLGMVVREEADFSPAPFALNPARNEAVDPSSVYGIVQVRILSGLTGLKIDPWGFLLPLTHLVWAVTVAALLGVLFVLQLFPSCQPGRSLLCSDWSVNAFSPVRVLLQQDVVWPAQWWWWERLVLGLWMLATLVLTKSYAGNLISLLAVRYVPQPFQTLQDIVDNVRVAVIAQKHSTFEQSLREVKYGVFHEIAELEDKGRLNFLTHSELAESLDTLVRAGHHVLVDLDVNHRKRMSLDFSRKGRCDFYRSRESYLPLPCSMVVQKTSPLLHGINKGLMTLFEKGIIRHWTDSEGNHTVCNNVPKKVMITSYISLSNIWGVFAMLGGGLTAGLVVWCAELVVRPSQQH
ncbi:ionotropic receptor 93a-like [Portunus trituberculatus]|uniref:ionotropic receptor 93a-like n=1 Tax=Portunus trituberculatus TaxID=210409 RepID=UPI001E1D1423|nr:ionotropic receptor 93a-like [Portunus trituberculatus]